MHFKYLYTLSMSKKINFIWDKKYVPREVATLVFVCQAMILELVQKYTRKTKGNIVKKDQLYHYMQKQNQPDVLDKKLY